MLRPLRGGQRPDEPEQPSLARAARLWADDEELFDEPTPPAPSGRRPDLAVVSRRPAPVAAPVPAPLAPAAGKGSGSLGATAAPPARPQATEGERAAPLRVFVGAFGADGSAARSLPVADTGEPIWDAAAIALRGLDGDRAARPAETPPDEEDAADSRVSGELPRTWLDPARLPAALERPHGTRPRRVGGVVQPVPGTPSAIAIAREEAESARFGPPPPLPSTMPLLIGRGWAAPEEAVDGPSTEPGTSGFQLVHEIPQATSAREVSTPPPVVVPPRPERVPVAPMPGVKPARRPGALRTVLIWGGLALVLTVLGFGVIYVAAGDQIREWFGPRAVETEPAPALAPEVPVEPASEAVIPTEPDPEAASPTEPVPEPTLEVVSPPVPTPAPEPVVAPEPATVGETTPPRPCEAAASEPYTGFLAVTSNLPGSLSVNGRSCGKLPTAPLRMKPGIYRVQVTARGRSQVQNLRVDAERAAKADFKF